MRVVVAAVAVLLAWLRALRVVAPTTGERAAARPGDPGAGGRAALVTDRGIDLTVPPEELWPWLVQMGYRRAGWYSHDRLEALLGAADYRDGDRRGTTSSTVVVDDLQDLRAGDRVPLGPGADLLAEVVAPPSAARPGCLLLTGVYGAGPLAVDWRWAWQVRARAGGGSRLHVRTTVLAGWLLRPVVPTLLRAGHAEMERAQLVNLRARVHDAAAP